MKIEHVLPAADLHSHTLASDGELAPWELVQEAAKHGLKAIAITDHDTISGWEEAEKAGEFFGLKVIKGIELSTQWLDKEVHLLGYGMNPGEQEFLDGLRVMQTDRYDRMTKILVKLRKLGIEVEAAEIEKIARGESVGRPHIAQALINQGVVVSVREAFEQYIGSKAPAYVPRFKITVQEGIELIRRAGGIPVLAHPGKMKLRTEEISGWVSVGLKGIEVYHPDHSLYDRNFYEKIAQTHRLIITGGSDYHGPTSKPGIRLGDWGVSLKAVHKIMELLESKN